MNDERSAEHRRAADAHEQTAARHDEKAADLIAQGDVEGAGREILNALIERQLAEDERNLAAIDEQTRPSEQ